MTCSGGCYQGSCGFGWWDVPDYWGGYYYYRKFNKGHHWINRGCGGCITSCGITFNKDHKDHEQKGCGCNNKHERKHEKHEQNCHDEPKKRKAGCGCNKN